MTNAQRCWTLWLQAKRFGCQPSQLLGIEDAYPAYCLNNAIYYFGTALESELESTKAGKAGDARRRLIMHRWMNIGKNETPKFRDPAAEKKD